ncbi:MAG: hypothetical protein CSB44_08435 [Gammaproteobacteria bacterium]|nr:MAG: hypothetical protein CSB44_08435 [Gammaproteobacteria bacterium]PIE36666.1 MAG: hypothetical protein CSA54_03735 [Gammaproteobacteria bacterium]
MQPSTLGQPSPSCLLPAEACTDVVRLRRRGSGNRCIMPGSIPAHDHTGLSKPFNTPDEAEHAFYDAIERGDMAVMDSVWSKSENIVCIHPGSTRIVGRSDVMQSFRQLFADSPEFAFTIVDTLETGTDELAIHLVREEVTIDDQLISVMVSTNIYLFEQGSWRMMLHHSSPEPDYMADLDDDFDEFDGLDGFDDEAEVPASPPVLH